MDDCKEYAGITREKLDDLKQGMRQRGLTPPEGDSGVIEAMGVKLSVTYANSDQILKFCILEKPAFIPAAAVWSQIESSLKA